LFSNVVVKVFQAVVCAVQGTQYTPQLETLFAVTAVTRKPDTQPSAPHYTDNLKTKHQI
jgi:hypothetical protein